MPEELLRLNPHWKAKEATRSAKGSLGGKKTAAGRLLRPSLWISLCLGLSFGGLIHFGGERLPSTLSGNGAVDRPRAMPPM